MAEDEVYKETAERDKLIYESIYKRYNLEWDRSKILDGKASGIISFVGIILALQSGLGTILIKDAPQTKILLLIYTFFIFSIIFLTLSILCGLRAYTVQSWKTVSEPNRLINEYAKKNRTRIDILRILGQVVAESIEANKINNDKKTKFIVYGFTLLVIGIIMNLLFIIGLITIKVYN